LRLKSLIVEIVCVIIEIYISNVIYGFHPPLALEVIFELFFFLVLTDVTITALEMGKKGIINGWYDFPCDNIYLGVSIGRVGSGHIILLFFLI
jgi:hypothetical protein